MFTLNKIFGMILKRKEQIHTKSLRSMSEVVLVIIVFIYISGLFNTTKALSAILPTSSSLLVVIVSSTAQQVPVNVISGIMLSWSRPFNPGERVNISSLGISGTVGDMTMRHTVTRTHHNSHVIIPNSVIDRAIMENNNYSNDHISNCMEVSVSYEDNLERTTEIIQKTIVPYLLAVDTHPDLSGRNEVNVTVKELGDGGIILKSTIWTRNTNNSFATYSDIHRLIKRNLDAAGISIPYGHVHAATENSDKKLESNGTIQR